MKQKKGTLSYFDGYQNILLHVPHSSTAFPEGLKYTWNDLDDEERLLIDYYTDELFAPQQDSKRINSIVFPYCRLFCDVERLANDPLEAKGLGISYRRSLGAGFRSFGTLQKAYPYYADHHAAMSKKIVEMNRGLLLIDCHSFSSFPNLLNSNPPDIDICIGYNDDETCPNKSFVSTIALYFESMGYKVGINTPFSNSKTFEVPVPYHSVMIEINKRLYMNEVTHEKTANFMLMHNTIQSLYGLLLNGNKDKC